MKGYMYILLCGNGTFYTGSTKYLERRLAQHQSGNGANYTTKHPPVELVYFEEFNRIDKAFYREKQVQNWSQAKKKALISGDVVLLKELSCRSSRHLDISTSSMTDMTGITDD